MANKLGYVSLFSGAGVGCYGFKLEEYDCIVTSEIIPRRLLIQKHNKVCSLDDGYIAGDINDPLIHEQIFNVIAKWKKLNSRQDIDAIIATPPCQGISVANHKKKDELGRNSLVVESIKIVNEIKPRYFIFENVRGFLNTVCTDTDNVNRSIQEAIKRNLAGHYNIGFKVLNFKDYGSNSSRTRTLVIGVRKDIEEITPFDLMPDQKNAPTLRQLISDLPKLPNMGDIASTDIYHSFRPYDKRMLAWVKDLSEGESAFSNSDPRKRPHTIVNGMVVANQNKNGDKYKRCYWDNVAPCVHTRNDILASQNTIHPAEPRVFSIRELMRFMSIPESFKWANEDTKSLNEMSGEEKKHFLKKNEVNIRQCLGEGVPTVVFQSIARKLQKLESKEVLSLNKIKRSIDRYSLANTDNLVGYLSNQKLDFSTATKIAELANAKRLEDAAYYTRQDLCFNLVTDLPDFRSKKNLRILEPAVGVGNFLPSIFEKYKDKEKVNLDLVDINNQSIRTLKQVLKFVSVPANFEIRFINDDFLLHDFRNKYDLVVGNPPFGKMSPDKLVEYKMKRFHSDLKTRNLFALFFEKSLRISSVVALFSPKSLLNAPEFRDLRNLLENYSISKISDYGEKGFNGVKIETISLQVRTDEPKDQTIIDSYILKEYRVYDQDYITDKKFPYWIMYRDDYFDEIVNKLELDLFTVYRDRSLTPKILKNTGKVRVVKSRNIKSGRIIDLDADKFVDDISVSPIAEKFFNKKGVIVAPNLSYYPRASFLPQGTIVDGSAAILLPKRKISLTLKQLEFFASKEYFMFYRVARNFATRSLNIDSSSVHFWGVPKKELQFEVFDEENKSAHLFTTPAKYFAGTA